MMVPQWILFYNSDAKSPIRSIWPWLRKQFCRIGLHNFGQSEEFITSRDNGSLQVTMTMSGSVPHRSPIHFYLGGNATKKICQSCQFTKVVLTWKFPGANGAN